MSKKSDEQKTAPIPTFSMMEFPLVVTGGNLEQKIKKANFSWKDNNITEQNFPVKGNPGPTIAILIFFERRVSPEAVLEEIGKHNLRTGTMDELIDFAAQYPDEQRKYPIIELDSTWRDSDGIREVGYLGGHVHERYMILSLFVDGWFDVGSRFLVFRE